MKVVALLRGINVGGNKLVPMAELRAMLEALGFGEVRTLLQSGNAVFDAGSVAPMEVEARLEAAIRSRFGFDVSVMVRQAPEWRAIMDTNPFPEVAEVEPGRLLAVFLKSVPASGAFRILVEANPGSEKMALAGRELFVHYVDGVGVSKLTPNLIEKHLGVRGTGRNWNTVAKIAGLL